MSRRGVAIPFACAVLGLALAAAFALAEEARRGPRPLRACVGSRLPVGPAYAKFRRRPGRVRVKILDPGGKRVWSRIVRPRVKRRFWPYRAHEQGTYRVVYRRGRRLARVAVRVKRCEPIQGSADIILSSDDGGQPLFTLQGAAPSTSATACIVVTYSRAGRAGVRLYGEATGTGLDRYLDLTLTRGRSATHTSGSCAGFTPDAVDYVGAGPGVIYRGTLRDFPDGYDAAPPGGAPWKKNESHAYRFHVKLRDDSAAQGLTAIQGFTWEARGSGTPSH